MSNIIACVSENASSMMADSLAYSAEGRSKNERKQKLFHVKGSIVSGTGNSRYIDDYVDMLIQIPNGGIKGPRELSGWFEDEFIKRKTSPEHDFTMYFAGLQGKKPALYVFSSRTKIRREINGIENYVLGGQGQDYMREAIKRDRNRGFRPGNGSRLSEMLDFMYSAAMAAQQNVHVNSEFQFGFIGKKGIKILYDPDVIIERPPPEYLEKDGSVDDSREGKKGINDNAYGILKIYIGLRRKLKLELNSAMHYEWNNIKPEKPLRKTMGLFRELDEMTMDFLENYLECDYVGYRQWIEDEKRDIKKFMRKIGDNIKLYTRKAA